MTADQFRALALQIPGVIESSHMGHPDFRIGGKIIATLGYPDDKHGMVKLTPALQRKFLRKAPSVFAPSAGAWGKQGSTLVNLAAARLPTVGAALKAASQSVSSEKKKPAQSSEPIPPRRDGSS